MSTSLALLLGLYISRGVTYHFHPCLCAGLVEHGGVALPYPLCCYRIVDALDVHTETALVVILAILFANSSMERRRQPDRKYIPRTQDWQPAYYLFQPPRPRQLIDVAAQSAATYKHQQTR